MDRIYKERIRERSVNKNFLIGLVTIFLLLGMGVTACDGPAGPEGPQGPEGPVGPASEDGSMIYSGDGAPDASIGDTGDYYLNQNTGELYGPKNSDGWGDDPIIVLMGEDGQDGADGEDGSVIHSGEGAPDANTGNKGDYYFDESSGEFYGPKTDDGWGEPTDLTGSDGEDGQDGEDGSVIHAGDGAPSADVGVTGDFYFDKTNGDFYGPKTDSGWGSPTNLTGEDGQDGQDGADGEDGSQIYSGSGAPDSELGVVGDYYLDKDNHDLYGPKTSDGWGSPLNLKGADGNANVTRYIFPGHDFEQDGTAKNTTPASLYLSLEDFQNSAWHVYLVDGVDLDRKYHVPGYGSAGDTMYRLYMVHRQIDADADFYIYPKDGPGEDYEQIEVIRVEASETIDTRNKQKGKSIIPDHLDTSNYEEVAEYYGFYR